jgi:hypothetical protein
MAEKINREVAVQDFERWLDFKRVSDNKREKSKDQEDLIVDGISNGSITIDDECNIHQILVFPVDGEAGFSELIYRPRINRKLLSVKLKAIKADDPDGRISAYAAALCNKAVLQIDKLDTEDLRVADAIVMYFL